MRQNSLVNAVQEKKDGKIVNRGEIFVFNRNYGRATTLTKVRAGQLNRQYRYWGIPIEVEQGDQVYLVACHSVGEPQPQKLGWQEHAHRFDANYREGSGDYEMFPAYLPTIFVERLKRGEKYRVGDFEFDVVGLKG